MTLPRTEQSEWASQQASPWIPVNTALRAIEAFALYTSVVDRDLNTPPVSCADGDRYLVATGGTSEWVGQDNHVAIAVGTNASNGWIFVDARETGQEIYVIDEATKIRWNGSAFVSATGGQIFADHVACSDQTTILTSGDVLEFEWGRDADISAIHAFVKGASDSSSEIEVNVLRNGASVFGTDKITIDALVQSSRNALIPPDLVTTQWDKGDIIVVNIINAGDNATGLILTFEGTFR